MPEDRPAHPPAKHADVNGLQTEGVDTGSDGEHRIELVVVGAHLQGLALHHQLTDRGARFERRVPTTPEYTLHALATDPPKPGLTRVADQGAAIATEVWSLDVAAFGDFVAQVPPPLAIGTVRLADGTNPKGFLCEPIALADAVDITSAGGWRAYLASQPSQTGG